MHSKSVSRSNQFGADFIYGIMVPIRAVGVLFSNSKLLTLSVLPIVSTIVLLSVAIYFFIAGFADYFRQWLMTYLHGMLSNYAGAVSVVLSSILLIGILFFALNAILFLASLLASPFNDFLAEETEKVIGVTHIPHQTLRTMVRVIWVDLKKTVLVILLSSLFWLGTLIPAIGVIFFCGTLLLTTFTFVTYPQSRRMHGVRSSIRWVIQNFGLALGFGFTTVCLFGIPVINLFALPVSVVGGTMLYFRTSTALRRTD